MTATIFERFERYDGGPIPGFQINWIGARSRTHYVAAHEESRGTPGYPAPSEDTYEWSSILEAVEAARGRFVMIELGAGYGRWLVNAALAARQRDLEVELVGVEAEPTRIRWLREHLADNG